MHLSQKWFSCSVAGVGGWFCDRGPLMNLGFAEPLLCSALASSSRECCWCRGMHRGTCWGQGDLENCTFQWGGVAPVFNFLLVRSFYYFPDTSAWTGAGNSISHFSFYWGQRQTVQINPKISPCGKSQRQSKGKWKIACAFKFLHDSDVWAKNIHYTLMSVPKQVWVAPSYNHVDAKECEQAARILAIFILPSTSSLFGSLL